MKIMEETVMQRGRPVVKETDDVRILVRISDDMLKLIDAVQADRIDSPSRVQVIRELLLVGLNNYQQNRNLKNGN
jgi:hypothetical protein